MLNNENLENLAMLIISNAGAARSCAFEALRHAKDLNFSSAADRMKEAGGYAHMSHDAHSELLKMDAKGEVGQVDLLLSHAQDHIMAASLAMELIEEIIALRQEMAEKGSSQAGG